MFAISDIIDPEKISLGLQNDINVSKTSSNIILYDWFSMSCRYDTVESIIDMLGFKFPVKWENSYGFYGYKNRIFFDGISIHFDHWNKETDFPLLEITGQGCRDFETYTNGDWDRLFIRALSPLDGYHVTRLDVAYDDHTGILDIGKMVRKTYKREFVARSQTGTITDQFKREIDAMSIMFGTRKSDFYIRIYDKARERGYTDGRHWIRCESVFKDDRAYEFLKNDMPIGKKYCGVLKNYLRFVDRSDDTNKRRWKMSKFWERFIGDCNSVSVYTPQDVSTNLSRIGRYIFHQAGNSIETYIRCVGLTRFLEELKIRDTRLNIHQKRIIDEYRTRIQSGIDESSNLLNSQLGSEAFDCLNSQEIDYSNIPWEIEKK